MVHRTLMPPITAVQVDGITRVPESPKPTLAVDPAPREPFQDSLDATRVPPEDPPLAFQMLVTVPDHGIDTVHPLTGAPVRLVTRSSTLRPDPQSEVTLTLTASPLPLGEDAVGEGVGVALGLAGADGSPGAGFGAVEVPTPATNALEKAHCGADWYVHR